MPFRWIAAVLVVLPLADAAQAQAPADEAIAAWCGRTAVYGYERRPVRGAVWRHGDAYLIDLYVSPQATRAVVGTERTEDHVGGWLHLELRSPSLDLADPEARVDALTIQGRALVLEGDRPERWRVRLRTGEVATWHGPGGAGQTVFTMTGNAVGRPYAAEPVLAFYRQDDDPTPQAVYRRVVEAGGVTAEFHSPRQWLWPGRLVSVSEFSLTPLDGFLADARAHFAACDAAASS